MASPIPPEVDLTTGRVLTEWFEYPEYTDEQIEAMACAEAGITVEERPRGMRFNMSPETQALHDRITGFIKKHKNRKWRQGMSQQEVAYRMNEATKMVSPDNYKFLPDDVRQRTGLEINPLWMIETLVRSGVLKPSEQVAALKELASYTHSKAPSISHSTTTHMKPEDWLLELAKDEYKEIEIVQPKTPLERGAGKTFEQRRMKRTQEVTSLISHATDELAELEAIAEAEWEELDPDE